MASIRALITLTLRSGRNRRQLHGAASSSFRPDRRSSHRNAALRSAAARSGVKEVFRTSPCTKNPSTHILRCGCLRNLHGACNRHIPQPGKDVVTVDAYFSVWHKNALAYPPSLGEGAATGGCEMPCVRVLSQPVKGRSTER
jgi:hypothetical protein